MRDEKKLWGLMIEVHSRGRDLKRESLSVLSRRVSFSRSQKQNVFDRFRLILGQNRDKSFHFVLLAKWTISFHVQIALCVRILVQQLWRPLDLFETNYFSFLKPILLYPQFMELWLITAFFPWIFDKSRFPLRNSEHSKIIRHWITCRERPRRVGVGCLVISSSLRTK